MNRTWTFILAVVALLAASACGHAQTQDPVLPKLSVPKALYFQNNPEARNKFLAQLPRRPAGQPLATPQPVAPTFGGTWTAVTTAPTSGLCNPLLLTDGTVLVHDCGTCSWSRIAPRQCGQLRDRVMVDNRLAAERIRAAISRLGRAARWPRHHSGWRI